jgi:hypothetical protein
MIALIPKEDDVRDIKKFRPSSLLNCIFRICTKALINRFDRIIDRLISFQQYEIIHMTNHMIE